MAKEVDELDFENTAAFLVEDLPAKKVIVEDTLHSESLDIYMKQLNRFPILTKDEEVQLAKSIIKNKDIILKICSEDKNILQIFYNFDELNLAKLKKLFANLLNDEPTEKDIQKLQKKFLRLVKNKLAGKKSPGLNKIVKELHFTHSDLLSFIKVVGSSKRKKTYTELLEAIQDLEQARKRLTECNLRLVFSRAKRFLNKGMTIEDLIQEGNLGLLRAIEKFDYTKGYKFSTYATHWIEQAFGRALANKSRLIRLPVHMVESVNRVNKATRELNQELGRDPTTKELATYSGESESKVKKIQTMTILKEKHIEDTFSETGDKLIDILPDESILDPVEFLHRKNLFEKLRNALATLSPRDEKILRMRFGIGEKKFNTLEDVGEVFGITRERVRQIQNKAVSKIKILKKEIKNDR